MKLYRVKIEMFGPYYVMANSTDEAIKKLKANLEKNTKPGERKVASYEVESVELLASQQGIIV
jgi:hypothetical protein